MIKEGRKAPAFNVESSDGGKVSLKDLAGQYAVIYFYPKDNTPGCTIEANDFNKARKKLEKLDAVVLGVSKDSIESHGKFVGKYKLKFPLLSDPSGKMLEKYDAWGEKNMYGKKVEGVIRSTFLIDEQGKIAKAWPKVRVKGHVDKVLAALEELA